MISRFPGERGGHQTRFKIQALTNPLQHLPMNDSHRHWICFRDLATQVSSTCKPVQDRAPALPAGHAGAARVYPRGVSSLT